MSLRFLALLIATALLVLAAPAPPAPAARATGRYLIELAAAPVLPGMATLQVAAQQADALAEVAAITAAPVTPVYRYSHALNGFALDLTPAEAAAVAALPSVLSVAPDWRYTIDSDSSAAFIGAAQADQRPALFFAGLSGAPLGGAPTGPTGRAVAHYNAATQSLTLQVFYRGLSGPPSAAALRVGLAGPVAADLSAAAVGAPAASGGYILSTTLDPAGEAALFAGQLYITIETVGAGGSEIAGALGAARGAGVVIGVLDTGIDPAHPSFADTPADGHVYTNPLGRRLGVCSPDDGDGRYDPSFPCNNKLIGAYTFEDTADTPDPQGRPSPRDNNDHGSHVAGIAAGNLVSGAAINGVDLGAVAGVAPHANLIAYDVCGVVGSGRICSGTAIVAAIDQAIADGVDIISLSLGGDSRDPWQSADVRGLLRAVGAGSFVVSSAGNGGPDPGTIGSPANGPWVTSVGSATHDRRPLNSLRDFAGGDPGLRPSAPLSGLNVTAGLGLTALVDAADLSPPNSACQPFSEAQQPQVAGKLVVCQRGVIGTVLKANNVLAAGGAGIVVLNDLTTGDLLDPSGYPLPGLLLGYADGQRLKAWLAGCSDCQAALSGFARQPDPAGADMLDESSSRGPDLRLPDQLKPDLVAPGVSVLAAGADANPLAIDYEQLTGTSMATPQVSGLAALLRQIHPDWSPAEIRSAMALTAVAVRNHDGEPALPFAQGAGRVSAGAAALTGFVLDVDPTAYAAADPAQGGDPSALNLPSLVDQECVGGCVFTRTLRSTLGVPVTWEISAQADGFTLTTEPAGPLTLQPGATATITIRAAVTQPRPGAMGYGSLRFTAQGGLAPAAAMPVAITLDSSTLPDEIVLEARRPTGVQLIPLKAIAISQLTVDAFGLVKLQPEAIGLGQDPTPDDLDDPARGGIYQQVLTLPAGNLRLRAQIDRSTAVDLDLIVFVDRAGVGFGTYGPEDTLLCRSASPGSEELCDIVAPNLLTGRGEPVQVTILVQNYRGSGATQDSFRLLWGRVNAGPTVGAATLTVGGPTTAAAGQPFDLSLAWSLPGAQLGDHYIGVLNLGSAPTARADLGAALITLELLPLRTSLPVVMR